MAGFAARSHSWRCPASDWWSKGFGYMRAPSPGVTPAHAANGARIDHEVRSANAVLVFPRISNANGDGALCRRGKPVGHYRSVMASPGYAAGTQSFGYAL